LHFSELAHSGGTATALAGAEESAAIDDALDAEVMADGVVETVGRTSAVCAGVERSAGAAGAQLASRVAIHRSRMGEG
jgi:hypothetical protein